MFHLGNVAILAIEFILPDTTPMYGMKPGTLHQTARLPLVLTLLLTMMSAISGCSAIGSSMKSTPTMSHWGGLISMQDDDLKARYTNEYSCFVHVNDYDIHSRIAAPARQSY
ncbi:hypothetical protein [Marinobacter sp.]|uniref:hypothetical protein n=1 Tax=Marinobacter sp. TaxID=50741 RepID=UPI00384DCC50